MSKFTGWTFLIILLLSSCNLPASAPEQIPVSDTPSPPVHSENPTIEPSPIPKPLDLSHRPLYWFGPLPPLSVHPDRPFIGSEDFISLFEPNAPWHKAAGHIQVFKLYGEWVAYQAKDAELQQVVTDLKRRGLALAVEAGPLDPPADCGQAIEGFAGREEGLRIARRIKGAGGVIDLIAMDEPYFFAHFYDGENACHWSVEKVAGEVDKFIQTMKAEFPNVIIGDTEPLTGNADGVAYKAWLDTFYQVNGYRLAFVHMDVDWSRIDWQKEVKAVEEYGREIGVPVGIIYTGNPIDKTDEAWLEAAGERVKKYELEAGGQPEHVLFQSWNDKPDYVLPENAEYTFTHFIDTYFDDKASLGFPREGAGVNLALDKSVQVSQQIPDNPAWMAVDGDPGTWWGAGDGPPNWIEIDLGAAYVIKEFYLLPSQYPAGRTVHKLLVRGPGTGDIYTMLTTFDGATEDGEPLIFVPDAPLDGIQFVRVETVTSPSWVAWREIQVIAAE